MSVRITYSAKTPVVPGRHSVLCDRCKLEFKCLKFCQGSVSGFNTRSSAERAAQASLARQLSKAPVSRCPHCGFVPKSMFTRHGAIVEGEETAVAWRVGCLMSVACLLVLWGVTAFALRNTPSPDPSARPLIHIANWGAFGSILFLVGVGMIGFSYWTLQRRAARVNDAERVRSFMHRGETEAFRVASMLEAGRWKDALGKLPQLAPGPAVARMILPLLVEGMDRGELIGNPDALVSIKQFMTKQSRIVGEYFELAGGEIDAAAYVAWWRREGSGIWG